jgi:hypothetical protein
MVFRFSPAPSLAALCLVLFEVLRLFFLETSQAITFGQWLVLGFAIGGLVGLPLSLTGSLSVWCASLVRKVWSLDSRNAISPSSRWGWSLYFLMGCSSLGLGVHFTVLYASKHFKKAVYVGLAGALSAMVVTAIVVAISVPIVGLLSRLIEYWSDRRPRWLDPTKRNGALFWISLLGMVAVFVVPTFIRPLDTVDLRPLRYLALWCGLLVVFSCLQPTPSGFRRPLVGALLSVLFWSGMVWSAHHLSLDQSRVLTISRDTILAGPLMRQF